RALRHLLPLGRGGAARPQSGGPEQLLGPAGRARLPAYAALAGAHGRRRNRPPVRLLAPLHFPLWAEGVLRTDRRLFAFTGRTDLRRGCQLGRPARSRGVASRWSVLTRRTQADR